MFYALLLKGQRIVDHYPMMTTFPAVHSLRNLAGGLRLALMLPVSRAHFTFNHVQLVIMLTLALLLDISGDWITAKPPTEFNNYGISYLLSLYLISLSVMYAIAIIHRQPDQFMRLVILLYASYPPVFLVSTIISDQLLQMSVVMVVIMLSALMAWSLIITFRIMRLLFHSSWLPVATSLMLFALVNYSAYLLLPEQPLWYGDVSAADNAWKKSVNTEDTYYQQLPLMEDALHFIQAGDPETVEHYFLGYSPDARQDVFIRESVATREMIDRLFDTRERSLLLANHLSTYREHPLANNHNLQLALNGIASKMNPDDILLLFLTGHGSKSHTLGASFANMQFNDLSAGMLASMLEQSGIRWRIIFISACYSGGFIDALQNPYSVIITSASRDRQSAGCSNDSNSTWFTDAYFHQALSGKRSFIEAFELARSSLQKREQLAGIAASQPQIFIGEHIKKRIK